MPHRDNRVFPPREYAKAPHGFAYLFARFPSFTQTFCFREVSEMRNQGLEFPIFSVRTPKGESQQDFPSQIIGSTRYLPEDFKSLIKKDRWGFGNRALMAQARLEQEWGDKKDKSRAHEAAWLAPILEELGVWHVHVHFAGLAARTAYWMKKIAGIRYSFTAHANDFLVYSENSRLEDLFREAEFVATVSDFSAKLLRERFPSRRDHIHRVYNGISVDQFTREQVSVAPPRILSVGRYIEKKGFSDLIKACAALRNEEFQCLVVGEGPLEQTLKNEVCDAGLEGKVWITGPRREDEVANLLSGTSVFVLPCKTGKDGAMDNLPTVIMEAMAASVPVVATRLAGIPEMVIHGETGYAVTEGDNDTLICAMASLLQDPAIAKKMGERGRSLAKERFDVSSTVGSLKSLLIRYGGLRRA